MTMIIDRDGSGDLFHVAALKLKLGSYSELSHAFGIDPGQISRIKNGHCAVSDSLRVAVLRTIPSMTIRMVDNLTETAPALTKKPQ